MTFPLLIFAIVGTGLIFAVAVWAGPKAIRAIYPEDQHERMIKLHRNMVIVALIVAVIGFVAGVTPFLLNA